VFYFILAFISGQLVKWVDNIEDDTKGKKIEKWPMAIFYGIVIGYLISKASFSMLFFGALTAQILANKIDKPAHVIGVIASLFVLLFFGFPEMNLTFFLMFLVFAYLDEQTFKTKSKVLNRILKFFTDYRLFLKLIALALIALGRWDFFIAVILFDVGYVVMDTILHGTKYIEQGISNKNTKYKITRKNKKLN